MGDQLSYEDLFKKNKKRGRSDRNSMANHASEMGSMAVSDNNLNNTMHKALKSMFNEPMSVRGIKHIEIEADEQLIYDIM
jgi:hypothetical protein